MRVLDVPRDRATLVVLFLLAGAAYALLPFSVGIFSAFVLCVLTAPMYDRLKRHISGALATTIIILLLLGLVVLPLMWLGFELTGQAQEVFRNAQSSPELASYARFRIAGTDLGTRMSDASGALISWSSGKALDLAAGLAGGLLQFAIACLCLAFLLPGRKELWMRVKPLIPFSAEHSEELLTHFKGVTLATVIGMSLVAGLQGAIIGLLFYFVGLPNALFWGVAAAITSVIPVIGSTAIWLPATLFLFFRHQPIAAIIMAVGSGGLAGNITSFVSPLVFRRYAQLHPLITLLGVLCGLRLFGLLGLILGPLLLSYAIRVTQMYSEEYTASRDVT
ncbi:MAG: AI-2E family transporter [Gemmatimonadota bacterium]|nr:AI-2E family transporter [Gemmatimonadota bacterium]